MEYGSRLRFILITIAGILLLIFSAWGIIAIANNLFGSKKEDTTKTQKIDLADYARASTSVKLRVEGPIVGDEKFVSYEIEVAQNYRKITVYRGYQNNVVSEQRYDNNLQAYEAFLDALSRAGYTTKIAGASEDDKAACATGKRYEYMLNDEAEIVDRSWNTSCTAKQGSMNSSNGTSIRALFKAQIPDYTTILVKDLAILL